jgi:tryptophanase
MSSAKFAEPFRIKVVEPLRKSTEEERRRWIAEAGYNLFKLRAEHVYIDCLTDSGTTAMSSAQWAAMMLGDESYAGSTSFYRFEESVRDVFGFEYVIPTHQGRGADNLLANILFRPGQAIGGNLHFDSMRVRAEFSSVRAVDLLAEEGYDTVTDHPFKGNIDLAKVEEFIAAEGVENIPVMMITVTCNNNGGQPVSMANIRGLSEICRAHGIPFYIDAARFAENAYFIKLREEGYADRSVKEIAREMFSLADGAIMSAKKDGMVNIGGFLCTNSPEVYAVAAELVMAYEGYKTYGGLAGRDLEAIAVGVQEGVDFDYLEGRIGQVEYLAEQLRGYGVPFVEPVGGNGVYVDATRFFPGIPQGSLPGVALAIELYIRTGVRCVELGTSAFSYVDDEGVNHYPRIDLVRVAISRRVYTNSHMDVIAEGLGAIHAAGIDFHGVRKVTSGQVRSTAHFTSDYELIK